VRVDCVAFSSDGRRVASADAESVKVWDAATEPGFVEFPSEKSQISGVAFSPDGRRIALVTEAGILKTRDSYTGQELLTRNDREHGLNNLVYSSDGQTIAFSNVYCVKVLDAATGQERHSLPGRLVAFSPDSRKIASGDSIVDAFTGRKLFVFGGGDVAMTFSADGRSIITATENGAIAVWDSSTGKQIRSFRHSFPNLLSTAVSRDGRAIARGSTDGVFAVWETSTGRKVFESRGHIVEIQALAFSPDGRRLASCIGAYGKPGEVKLLDAWTGQELITLKAQRQPARAMAFSPDGRCLALASWEGVVGIWDAREVRPEVRVERAACR
jgi:WD40 repeat protein